MQIYADVLRMPVRIAGSLSRARRWAAAIFAAVAAGPRRRAAYDDRVRRLPGSWVRLKAERYLADGRARAEVYDRLYAGIHPPP